MPTPKIPTTAEVEKAIAPYQDVGSLGLLVITDDSGYVEVTDRLKDLKARQKELKELKETLTRPVMAAHKAILDMFAEPEDRLKRAESTMKSSILVWTEQQERERRAEEARLREEQRKLEEKAEAKATRLEARGKTEQAEAARESVPPMPIVITERTKVSGVNQRKVWKGEVVDFVKFAAWAVGNGRWELLEVNNKSLQALATATRNMTTVPGVRVWEDTQIAARASS